MNDFALLAKQKEQRKTGHNTNYYLQVIPEILLPDTVTEAEDIIEVVDMNFAAGTVFKAIWRLCKLRQDLGKSGSTGVYESEKSFYSSKRIEAIFARRGRHMSIVSTIFKTLRTICGTDEAFDYPNEIYIEVNDPKRLEPYSFFVGDLIHALGATPDEGVVLGEIIALSLMRYSSRIPYGSEERHIRRLVLHACCVEQYEKERASNVQV